jgi:predicted phage terminase large subunit-like protein
MSYAVSIDTTDIPETVLGPQPGPQTEFLSTSADIAIYGGAAGGGKTFALLMEPLRHHENPNFGAVIFRRTSKQVRIEGGLWDESMKLYPLVDGYPRPSNLDWTFPSGVTISFDHMEHANSYITWQGAQIPLIMFDELTHFTEQQFFYMLSRNRSTSGIPGYIRATTNPDVDSWVRTLIDWWVGDDGYIIPERSGKIRWFVRINDSLAWADSREELEAKYGADSFPKSLTFIAAKLADNQILMQKDPTYLASLKALPLVDRERLLGDMERGGNWNTRATAGTMFQEQWFKLVDAVPAGYISCVRFWDRAATIPSPQNKDPDWTRGLKVYKYANGDICVGDLKSMRGTPGQVETFIRDVAETDGRGVRIAVQQDPGSAGVKEADHFVRMLAGYDVRVRSFFKDKVTRAKPVSAQAEHGHVLVLKAPWNRPFFEELVAFPDGRHDDIVDTLSGAYNEYDKESTLDAIRANSRG